MGLNTKMVKTVYRFERPYDPTHLNLEDNKESWKIYAEKVRAVMAKCLDVPMVQ